MNEALQSELLALAERDNRLRAELVATGELSATYNARMAEVHNQNAAKLERIVREFGWPGTSLVGDDGAEAAWLVLQHAIAKPALQRECLPLLQAAAKAGEVPAYQAAFLEDRICFFEGRAQRYGTQFDWDDSGVLSPHTLEDPERVDDYRESVGLGPLSEKAEEVRLRAADEGATRPTDFQEYQAEKEEWARSVGWR